MSKLTDSNKDWLMSFESGKIFFAEKMKNSRVTEQVYTMWLKRYCTDIQKTPDELLKLNPTQLELMAMFQKGLDISKLRDHEADLTLMDYINFNWEECYKKAESEALANNTENKHPKPTITNKIGLIVAVRSFYSANSRDLAKNTGKSIMDNKPEAKQRSPSIADCMAIENCTMNRRNKFLVWLLVCSPIRVNTLRKMKWRDLRKLDDSMVPSGSTLRGLG